MEPGPKTASAARKKRPPVSHYTIAGVKAHRATHYHQVWSVQETFESNAAISTQDRKRMLRAKARLLWTLRCCAWRLEVAVVELGRVRRPSTLIAAPRWSSWSPNSAADHAHPSNKPSQFRDEELFPKADAATLQAGGSPQFVRALPSPPPHQTAKLPREAAFSALPQMHGILTLRYVCVCVAFNGPLAGRASGKSRESRRHQPVPNPEFQATST